MSIFNKANRPRSLRLFGVYHNIVVYYDNIVQYITILYCNILPYLSVNIAIVKKYYDYTMIVMYIATGLDC